LCVRLDVSRSGAGCVLVPSRQGPPEPRPPQKLGPLVLVIFAIVLGAQPLAFAFDGGDGEIASTSVAAVAVVGTVQPAVPIEPWIHHKMGPGVRARLEAGFDLAIERVSEIGACADLFTRLGADGIDMLKTGLYLPVASYRHEIVVCGRDPAARSRR